MPSASCELCRQKQVLMTSLQSLFATMVTGREASSMPQCISFSSYASGRLPGGTRACELCRVAGCSSETLHPSGFGVGRHPVRAREFTLRRPPPGIDWIGVGRHPVSVGVNLPTEEIRMGDISARLQPGVCGR